MPSLESPSVDLYPSCKVRLIIRFEEFADTAAIAKLAPSATKLPTQLKGTKVSRGALKVVPDPTSPPGTSRLLIQAANAPAAGGPQTVDQSSDGRTHPLGAIIPFEAKWSANGFRKADELKVSFPFFDCPVDPRCIRSVAIEFYVGTITSEEFARGAGGEVRASYSGSTTDGEPLSVVPDTYLDAQGRQRTNLRFQGWVDTWKIEVPEGETPMVRIECRDNSALLFDQELPPKLTVDATLPLDQSVATLLSNFPQFEGLAVEYRPAGVTPPTMKDALSKTAYPPKLGPTMSKGGGAAESQKVSVMDYLADVCGALGHNVHVEGLTVVIQSARNIYKPAQAREDDPFQGRTVGGVFFPNRLFIYGRNVLDYEVERAFARVVPKTIEVRSYNTLRKNVIAIRFPADVVSNVNPGDGYSERKVEVVKISGVADAKTLRLVAQSVYETLGRNELGVRIKTKNLQSFGGLNTDPDILDMRFGDSVELLVNRADEEDGNTFTDVEKTLLIQANARKFMQRAGYSGPFADAYAKAFSNAGFQTAFVVRAFTCDWSDEGIALEIHAVNYIEVRNNQELPNGEGPSGVDTAGASQTSQTQPAGGAK